MNKIIEISTQEQLDALKKVSVGEEVIITNDLTLNCRLDVFGVLKIKARLNCSWNGRYVVAWENASVVARENASVEAWENASVVAWENASVEARGNASVVARGNACLRLDQYSPNCKVKLFGFSVCFKPFDLKISIQKTENVHIQEIKPLDWFENNGIEKKEKIILYKKVSKDFKTQEGTPNETLWKVGSKVTHPNWQPKNGECGEGKYHACSRPYFCDEFRNQSGDKYIAIEISLKDLYEWKDNPSYPHKIGFRKGKVLFECDKFGKDISQSK